MAGITLEQVHKQFPDGTVAVRELDLQVGDGELFVLLGPSGCGKTTTLRCIAGLEQQTSGDIRIGDELVNGLRASQRDIAMVFQFYALYPHLSARDNISFPLRSQGMEGQQLQDAVQRAAEMLKIEHLLDRKPQRLSGGEQQRIALGRAFVREPQVFLMDEPLTNLDAELREAMRSELKHHQEKLGTTTLYVTHDQVEAMSLGHRIAIMNDGDLEQVGTPLEVYRTPRTLFVASFIGMPPMNLFEVEIDDGALRGPGGLRLPAPQGLPRDGDLVAGARAEWFELVDHDEDGGVDVDVVAREALGDEIIYAVELDDEELRVRMPPSAPYRRGDAAAVRFVADAPRVYDATTGTEVGE